MKMPPHGVMVEARRCKHLHLGSKANLWCAALHCCRHILTLVTIECDYPGCHFICQLQTYGFLRSHSPLSSYVAFMWLKLYAGIWVFPPISSGIQTVYNFSVLKLIVAFGWNRPLKSLWSSWANSKASLFYVWGPHWEPGERNIFWHW